MGNKIFFLPASQIDNTGDVLINKVLLDELRKHGELIINDKGKPEWFLKEIGAMENEMLSKLSNLSFYEYLETQLSKDKENRYSLVVHPGHTSRFGYKSALYGDHGFLFTRFLRRLKKKGCNILRFGFSIGPFDIYNSISEMLYTTVFKKYAVRDTESFKLGKRNLLQNIVQMPDLAWSYKNDLQSDENKQKPYIIISFRSNSFGSIHNSTYLKPFIEHLKVILPDNKKIKIVYQVKYDREPATEIYESLREFKIIELIDNKLDLQSASNLYKDADYIISNRLHVLLLGLVQGVLAFPLIISGDNDKIINIYKDNGLEDYILHINQETLKNKGLINEIYEDIILRRKKLKEIINQNDKLVSTIVSNSFA